MPVRNEALVGGRPGVRERQAAIEYLVHTMLLPETKLAQAGVVADRLRETIAALL